MASAGSGRYILGIDMGTTSIKVALIDVNSKEVVKTASRETQANIHSALGSEGDEQDPQKILTSLQYCVSGLPKHDLVQVKQIGISGQMHGVVFWKQGNGWTRNSFGRYEIETTSQLFTWQDGRCTTEFLNSLPTPRSHLKLASGMGCSTIFWFKENVPDSLMEYDRAGTIQDLVVAMLCGLDKPLMSVQLAASWGYFDTATKTWNLDLLHEAGFPVHLLPPVVDSGKVAGHLTDNWYGIPEGVPVGAGLGDLQCSTLSRLENTTDAVLNISTSAQLAFQMHEDFVPSSQQEHSTIEYFPYFGGRYLAVAASLTGGNAMAAFVKMLQQWTHELGMVGIPNGKLWETLLRMSEETSETDLVISPTIYGERHAPDQRASVTNITTMNTGLGSVFRALCKGVIHNLHSMMSQENLHAADIKRIIGSGNAVVKNKLLQNYIESFYKLPLVLVDGIHADAAIGAAKAMLANQ